MTGALPKCAGCVLSAGPGVVWVGLTAFGGRTKLGNVGSVLGPGTIEGFSALAF